MTKKKEGEQGGKKDDTRMSKEETERNEGNGDGNEGS